MKPSPFDQRLRQALLAHGVRQPSERPAGPGPAGPASNDCLDADTLAAWADDALGARQRALVEAHAAGCSRCLALVAAVVRATPEATVAATAGGRWWQRPVTWWLVPLTAAATAAVLLWMVPSRRATPASPNAVPVIELSRRADEPVRQPPTPEDKPPATQKARGATAPAKRAAPFGARPSAAPEPSASASAAAPQIAAAPSVAPAPPAAQSAAAAALNANGATAERSAEHQTLRMGRPIADALVVQSQADIVSPDPGSRWRIARDGSVLHSVNGGTTWETQQTGAAATLTAGSAPSRAVCWLVGPGGLVLLTTDGRSWRRLTFPERVDLSSIRATDDRTATVTASDGRTFTTPDGGDTWISQEKLPAPF